MLIEPGNIAELTEALSWIHSRAEDERSQLSRNARNKVEQYAGISSVVDQLLNVYSFTEPGAVGHESNEVLPSS